MKKVIKAIGLTGLILMGSFSQAAVINIGLTVSTEDGFSLYKNGGNTTLEAGSLVRVGYFYSTVGAVATALTSSEISTLFSGAGSFGAAKAALTSRFLEVGTGKIGYNVLNGLAAGYFAEDYTPQDRPFGTPAYESLRDDMLAGGTFFRGWMDGTLPIEGVSTSPFNSISNVALTGKFLSVIAYDAATEAGATSLLVATSMDALPSASDATAFALGQATSALVIGQAVTGGYALVPEPSSLLLLGLGFAFLFFPRRKLTLTR